MIKKILSPYTDPIYALLRVVTGLLFAFHGIQKLFGVFSKPGFTLEVGSQLWFGAVIEMVAGLAIAIGFFTPWAAFLSSGTMAVAYAQFHWKFALDANFFPAVNKGEPALLFALIFLYMACRGSGIWSVDYFRKGSGKSVHK